MGFEPTTSCIPCNCSTTELHPYLHTSVLALGPFWGLSPCHIHIYTHTHIYMRIYIYIYLHLPLHTYVSLSLSFTLVLSHQSCASSSIPRQFPPVVIPRPASSTPRAHVLVPQGGGKCGWRGRRRPRGGRRWRRGPVVPARKAAGRRREGAGLPPPSGGP